MGMPATGDVFTVKDVKHTPKPDQDKRKRKAFWGVSSVHDLEDCMGLE